MHRGQHCLLRGLMCNLGSLFVTYILGSYRLVAHSVTLKYSLLQNPYPRHNMHMRSHSSNFTISVCFALISTCAIYAADSPPPHVSCYQLVATPSQFVGKKLTVEGEIVVDGHEIWMFPTVEDADHGNYASGIAINLAKEDRNKLGAPKSGRLLVTGIFNIALAPSPATGMSVYAISGVDLESISPAIPIKQGKRDAILQSIGAVFAKMEILESVKKGAPLPSEAELMKELEQLRIALLRTHLGSE